MHESFREGALPQLGANEDGLHTRCFCRTIRLNLTLAQSRARTPGPGGEQSAHRESVRCFGSNQHETWT